MRDLYFTLSEIFLSRRKFIFLLTFVFPILSMAQTPISKKDSIVVHYGFAMAADSGNVQQVKSYINLGVNLDYRDEIGATALFYAVNAGHQEIIKILLYAGADPNIGTYTGFTPLMNASSQGDFNSAQLLLYNAKTKLNLHNTDNATALHFASYYGNFYIVDMLLYYGADANLTASYHTTPLLLAAYNGDTAISALLIQNGNSILQQNSNGNSPIKVTIQESDTLLFDFYLKKLERSQMTGKQAFDLSCFAINNKNNDALQKILKFHPIDSLTKNKSDSLIRFAYALDNQKLIESLNQNDIYSDWKPFITSFNLSFSTAFNSQDYISYFGMGIGESRYKLDFMLRYGTRFKDYAILTQVDENTFYQYLEKRQIVSANIRKSFVINKEEFNFIRPYVSFDFQWHFGSYSGITEKISKHFNFVPEIGVSFGNRNICFDLGYQYSNFNIYNVSPHRIKLGIRIRLLDYVESNKKYIEWM